MSNHHLNLFYNIQGNATATHLKEADEAGTLPKELYNHYTVISWDSESGAYSQVANAAYYKKEFADLVAAFDRWIAGIWQTQNILVEDEV